MARINFQESEHYESTSRTQYFSLKDNGDTARVRFMYRNIDDLEGMVVHEVDIDGRTRYVNCLRAYNEPLDKCPLCAAHRFQRVKLFIPLYNEDTKEVQIWERGKSYFQKLSSLIARYATQDSQFVSQQFDIVRNGAARSMQTTYEAYPVGQPDGVKLEDLPEIPSIIGTFVLDKTEDELQYYLQHGVFPGSTNVDAVIRRREPESVQQEPQVDRRVPGGRTNVF